MRLKHYYGDFRASEGREWIHKELSSHFPCSLVASLCGWWKGAALQVLQLVSLGRVVLRKPEMSLMGSSRTQVTTLKYLEFSFRRTALGPDALLSDIWVQLSQQLKTANPIFSSQIRPLDCLWLRLANYTPRLCSFPNIDKP